MRTAHVALVVVASLIAVAHRPVIAAAVEKDLQDQIAKAQPGAVVTVPKGAWREPLHIDKPLTLRGEDRDGSVIDVEADMPAIRLAHAKGAVLLENLTVRWQRATSAASREMQAAIVARDGAVQLKNVRVVAPGGYARCPSGLAAEGFADVKIDRCAFEGFEFTIQFGGGAKGLITDTIVEKSGHCGITAGPESNVEVARSIVTGSRFHGIRCTSGELNVHENLIVDNKNRGVYLGNRPASGVVRDNVIQGNGSGISAFAESDVKIHNNYIAGNDFSGVDMRDGCRLDVQKNLLIKNGRALALFKESGENRNVIGVNAAAGNRTDAEGFAAAPVLQSVKGELPAQGEFAIAGADGFGLSDPDAAKQLWKRWTEHRGTGDSAAPASAAVPPAAATPAKAAE